MANPCRGFLMHAQSISQGIYQALTCHSISYYSLTFTYSLKVAEVGRLLPYELTKSAHISPINIDGAMGIIALGLFLYCH